MYAFANFKTCVMTMIMIMIIIKRYDNWYFKKKYR